MSSFVVICILSIALLCACLCIIIFMLKLRSIQQPYTHLKSLVNNIPDLTWVKDDQSRFLFVNEQFSKAFNLSTEDIIGKTDFDICSNLEQAKAYYEDDLATQKAGKTFRREELITASNGVRGWAETIKVPVFDKHNQVVGTAGMARDISQRKVAEHKINHIAYHDHLTDLPNRLSFNKKITKLLQHNNCAIAVILFNLNNFKGINDSLGHISGDEALTQLANRLKTLVDENTIIARLSDDVFAIAHNYAKFKNSFEKLQSELLQQFDAPVELKDVNYKLNASFGIAVGPRDGRNYETLLKHADLAMSQSKANKNKHCVSFEQKLADDFLYKVNISNLMHQGINKQQFSLVYQPKVNTITNELSGVESLLRWQLDDETWISPGDFIPIAEKNGFIIELGNWVIKRTLKQIRKWLDKDIIVMPVSVNVSAIQLAQPNFVNYLLGQLKHYQIPGHLLEIELTEGVLMEKIEEITPLLNKIRNKGVRISIDDFGTGYSSLAYLPRLPLDTLKIDRVFISNIHFNEDNQKITQAIVSLANNFNLSVIAEGVETIEELEVIRSFGIEHVQGYYYSRPLSLLELEKKWLHKKDNAA